MTTTFETDKEIVAQPAIWESWAPELAATSETIRGWIEARQPHEIWLCGAGTSAFIGDCLAPALDRRRGGIMLRNVPTTELVARPQDFFRPGLRPLVVSFGRSGNSSESVGTLDLLDRLAPEADRLNITCNKGSALATREPRGTGEQQIIVLPDACHDEGFAMTSSYTTMLLTAMACLGEDPTADLVGQISTLAADARSLLSRDLPDTRPERAVFLGSGPFYGTAREAALKVLELTAGEVVTSWDSTLGFRHGPKAVINDRTAVYVFLSSDPLTRKYDQDIVVEIRNQFPDIAVTSVGRSLADMAAPDIVLSNTLNDVWNAPVAIIVAQRLAVMWSKALAMNVDDPFAGRNLTRVVSHVQLYV